MAAPVIKHCAPARQGRRYTKPEKTERRFRQDCARHADTGLNEHRLDDVRNQVAQDDVRIGSSQRASRFDEIQLSDFENLTPNESCVTHPANGN